MNHLQTYNLIFLNSRFALCRLPHDANFPGWAVGNKLIAFIRTQGELTLICDEEIVPANITTDRGWCAIYIDAALEFDLVGVLAAILNPLAAAGIAIYALSTYSTDYILIRCDKSELAKQVLSQAGYKIITQD